MTDPIRLERLIDQMLNNDFAIGKQAAQPLTTKLALHPDGTPQVSIGPAVNLASVGELVVQPPTPAPASDGEREELAAWLENQAADLRNVHTISAGLSWAAASRRAALLEIAATLLRQSAPAAVPVAVAERPWEREGWCDWEGMCWAEHIGRGGTVSWRLVKVEDMGGWCARVLPAHAIPQPPHGGEVAE